MKSVILLAALVMLVIILAKLPTSVVSDTSRVESNIPDSEITINQTQASNSSASATIAITMYTGDEE